MYKEVDDSGKEREDEREICRDFVCSMPLQIQHEAWYVMMKDVVVVVVIFYCVRKT